MNTTTTAAPDGAVIKTSIESVQGAVANFDKIAAGLAALEAAHPKDVLVDVTKPAGMRLATAARAAWREPRIAVEKARKEAKAPVLALGKQIDAFAAGLETQLRLGEDHYDAQIKAEEARKEQERQERARQEQARIAGHMERIAEIRGAVAAAAGCRAELILDHIGDVDKLPADATFEEFADQAKLAKAETLSKLREMHAAAVEREAAEARAKAEREELERLRNEQAERDRQERERVAAAQAAEAKRLAEERAALERQQAAARVEQKRLDDEAAARRAEEDRKAREAREAEQRAIDEQRAQLAREQEAAAAEQRRKDAEAAEARRKQVEKEEMAKWRAQKAEGLMRNAAQHMLDALRVVRSSAGFGALDEVVRAAVNDAIAAATEPAEAFAEDDIPY